MTMRTLPTSRLKMERNGSALTASGACGRDGACEQAAMRIAATQTMGAISRERIIESVQLSIEYQLMWTRRSYIGFTE